MTGRKNTNKSQKTESEAEKSIGKASISKAEKKVSAKPKKTAKAKNEATGAKGGSNLPVETLKMLSRAKKHTPAVFKLPSKKQTPIVFSLEDVREVLKKNKEAELLLEKSGAETEAIKPSRKIPAPAPIKTVKKAVPKAEKHRVLGAASVADILGFNPAAKHARLDDEVKKVPKKQIKFYRKLVELREHVLSGLNLHSKETLKRSMKEDSGDLSNYSQHMADAGTDNFERDFALNLLSSEQEALFEIEEAIKRIFSGTYGTCMNTGKPISRERLEAVPFTRYSLEGQAQKEKESRKQALRRGAFIDSSVEAGADFTKGNAED